MTQKTFGKVIVIEGLDGSGKQTQSSILFRALKHLIGARVRMVSFPNYDSPSSSLVKMYLSGEFNDSKECYKSRGQMNHYVQNVSRFYAIDRLATFIRPEEKDGTKQSLLEFYQDGGIIICDRYYTSNQLHQSAFFEGDEEDILKFVTFIKDHETKELGIPVADEVLFLKTSPETSIQNIKNRYADTDNSEDILENIEHLENVLKHRDAIIQHQGWSVIECELDGKMRPIEEISLDIAIKLNIITMKGCPV